jgi:tetratricopeptide (TPR) repeat protein
MPLTVDQLIEKSKDQRKRNRLDEALISAMAAVDTAKDNADAWWQLGLSRLALADNEKAIPALRKTVELAPDFAYGWTRLGSALLKLGNEQEAKLSFEKAVDLEEEEDALKPLSEIYARENNCNQDESEISILDKIDDYEGLESFQLNRLGNLHFRNNNYFEAIKYWKRDVAISGSRASRFNIGLAYNQPSISQLADAIDMWRLTLRYHPDYELPAQKVAELLPNLIIRAQKTKEITDTVLTEDQWFMFYLNPFQLINATEDLDYEDFEPKTIQKLKKKILQEIDLEDGVIPWLEGTVVDKSKAINLCDELNDEDMRWWHWNVFSYKPLLDFLHNGSYEHFLVDKDESPLDIIELLEEDDDFRDWISAPFSRQFDLVLSSTLEALSKSSIDKELHVLKCLLDGRRWVSSSHEDRCFENSRRIIDKLLTPLRDAAISSENKAPSLTEISNIVENKGIARILNMLPVYFNDYRNEAVSLLREIAINCFNLNYDHKLSKATLDLTKLFNYKSVVLNEKLKEDFRKIEEISISRLLIPLRKASDEAEESIPNLSALKKIIDDNNIATTLNGLHDDFSEYQNEAVSIIRDISISCFNIHGDSDLSKSVLQLTVLFKFKSDSLSEKIKEDFKTIENIVKEERKYEAKKTSGSDAWEITKEGVKLGNRFIATSDVSSLRWGVVITRSSSGTEYDFLLAVKSDDGRAIAFKWKTSKDIETGSGHFDDLVNAAISYLFPVIITRIEDRLSRGGAVKIGECRLTKQGVEFETSGWFTTDTRSIPWGRVSASIENGELTINDISSHKIKITMSLRETDNAAILNFMANNKK